jgi:hypothetical protein
MASSVVGTGSTSFATKDPFQRKCFYANGLFWVIYSSGTNMICRTSTDNITWSDETTIRAAVDGNLFSIYFDGTYMHYAYASGASAASGSVCYRRGTPNSNGTITWSADEQEAVTKVSSSVSISPFVSADSDGYPWVAYRYTLSGSYYPYVTKSSTNDGTWVTDTGFPYKLDNNDPYNDYWRVSVIPLTLGKVWAMACEGKAYGWLWTGSWSSRETMSVSTPSTGTCYSVVAEGDNIHLAFSATTDNIRYRKRTYGVGWGDEATIQSMGGASRVYPTLSLDPVTGTLYGFWGGTPTADHVYYKKCIAGTWDADPTDWMNETTDHLAYNDGLNSFYKAYGDNIGLVYTTKTTSPYNIKFNYLNLTQPPAVSRGMISEGLVIII